MENSPNVSRGLNTKTLQHRNENGLQQRNTSIKNKNDEIYNSEIMIKSIMQDPETQNKIKEQYLKFIKHCFNMEEMICNEKLDFAKQSNVLKLQNLRNGNDHQKRQQEITEEEHNHLKIKNELDLQHRKRVYSIEIEQIESNSKKARTSGENQLNSEATNSNEVNEQLSDVQEINSICLPTREKLYKIRHVICDNNLQLNDKHGISVLARAPFCSCKNFKKTDGKSHAHYIIDVTGCKDHVSRIIEKRMKGKFIWSKKITNANELERLLKEFQVNARRYSSKFTPKSISKYF